MKAENRNSHAAVIERLFAVVKELRFIYKQLFWRDNGENEWFAYW